jgi:tetratricopeptide (TPR) repeat protein
MPKQQGNAQKANGNPVRRRRPRPRKVATNGKAQQSTVPPSASRAKNGASSSETKLRFQMASLLRLSENLVNRAVGAYDRLFALEPRDRGEIYIQMGKELAQRGNVPDALEAFRKARELCPHDLDTLIEIGLLQLERGAAQAAVQAFEQAKTLGPPSHRLHKALADALIVLERYEEALSELESALRLEPNVADHYYQLGIALDRLGRYQDAVKAFEIALQLGPNEVVYHQSLGFSLESMGKRSEAIRCFKRALELERAPGSLRRSGRG